MEIEKLPPTLRDLHITFMLTGARRTSLLNVRRQDVDFAKGVLTFRHMKVGGAMMFPMGPHLAARLKARMAEDEPLASEWLWPSIDGRVQAKRAELEDSLGDFTNAERLSVANRVCQHASTVKARTSKIGWLGRPSNRSRWKLPACVFSR